MQGASDLLVRTAVSDESVGLSDLWLEDQGSPAHWLVGRLNTVTLVVLEAQRTQDQWSCVVLTRTAHSELAEWQSLDFDTRRGRTLILDTCSGHGLVVRLFLSPNSLSYEMEPVVISGYV